jgi:Ribosomal protein L7Ae/L30e/S12e/Gadd45 family.
MVEELSKPQGRVAGLKQVLRYARLSGLEKVYVARDADEEIAQRLHAACVKHGIPVDMTHTMHQIGSACGLEVGSACAGVLKSGR